VDEVIAEKGFVTVQEPACGAGGMILAAADVLAAKGHDIGQHLFVDATDISPMCFRMSYLQASLRGIPATIHRGNLLSLEMFEAAHTPAFFPFYLANCQSALNIAPPSASKIDPHRPSRWLVPVVHRGDPRGAECPLRG